jgi:hypothetical protein
MKHPEFEPHTTLAQAMQAFNFHLEHHTRKLADRYTMFPKTGSAALSLVNSETKLQSNTLHVPAEFEPNRAVRLSPRSTPATRCVMKGCLEVGARSPAHWTKTTKAS